jgi:hypothetical protein
MFSDPNAKCTSPHSPPLNPVVLEALINPRAEHRRAAEFNQHQRLDRGLPLKVPVM